MYISRGSTTEIGILVFFKYHFRLFVSSPSSCVVLLTTASPCTSRVVYAHRSSSSPTTSLPHPYLSSRRSHRYHHPSWRYPPYRHHSWSTSRITFSSSSTATLTGLFPPIKCTLKRSFVTTSASTTSLSSRPLH